MSVSVCSPFELSVCLSNQTELLTAPHRRDTLSLPSPASHLCLANQGVASGQVHVAGAQPPAVRESGVGFLKNKAV